MMFNLESYQRYGGFEHMPKGDLFTFGVNPYNGRVVVRFNDRHENAVPVIEDVLAQIDEQMRVLSIASGLEVDMKLFADYLEGKLEIVSRPKVAVVAEGVGDVLELRKVS